MTVKRIGPLTPEETARVGPEALRALLQIVEERHHEVFLDTPAIPGTMSAAREAQWKANIDTLNLYSYTVRTLEGLLGLPPS